MHPELISVPFSLKTYGFCLMIGFLSAVWLAMRRARHVKVNPDIILDMSFLALFFGVGGARAFYVIHYWPTFAAEPNTLIAIINLTQGGLEFLGGFLGATAATLIYLIRKKQSIRLCLDIMAPSVMWGLAIGRLGCFFNGCCFGGLCVEPGTQQARFSWAVQFPYHSPAHRHQLENRQTTVPAELMQSGKLELSANLVPATDLTKFPEDRDRARAEFLQLFSKEKEAQKSAPNAPETAELQEALTMAKAAMDKSETELMALSQAQRYPSRIAPQRKPTPFGARTTVSELEDLAAKYRSLPVHPTQLYSSIHAMLLFVLLSAVFYLRKRHGVVMATLLLLYPFARVPMELIRADNPHDTAGMTVSMSISLGLFLVGIASLVYLYKFLPERSPKAEAAAIPVEEEE